MTEKAAPRMLRDGRNAGGLGHPTSENHGDGRASILPRHHNRMIARLDWARSRVDRATELMQHALDLREQLGSGLDLEAMRDQVDAFKRAVAVYAQRAS